MVIVKNWLLLWFFFPPARSGRWVTWKVTPRPSQPNCSNSKFFNLSFQKAFNLHEFYETLSLVLSKYNLWDWYVSLCSNVMFLWKCDILEQLWFVELRKLNNSAIKFTCFLGNNNVYELSGKNSKVQILPWLKWFYCSQISWSKNH